MLRNCFRDHQHLFSDYGLMIVSSKFSLKKIGVFIDPDTYMSTPPDVNELYNNLYFQIKDVGNIRSYLDESIANALATPFIVSKLDYRILC